MADDGALLGITSHHHEEMLVVSLRGRLTSEGGAQLLDWLSSTPRVLPHVLVNVGAITSVDAGGAEALLDAFVATALRDGTLALTNPTTELRELLYRRGVLPVVEAFVDDALAVATIRSRRTAPVPPVRSGSLGDVVMLDRPRGLSSFEFVRIAALRTAQLMRGCVPLVPSDLKPVTTAMREVAAGRVRATRRQRP